MREFSDIIRKRFWAKCKVGGANQCWEWTASTRDNRSGQPYGHFRIDGKSYRANRVAHEMCNGEIPKNMVARHKCDNTLCVNPNHLIIGTYKQNNKDMYDRNRDRNRFCENHPNAKLRNEDIPKILEMRKNGMTYQSISDIFVIGLSSILSICKGKNWNKVSKDMEA